jgi:cobalt-zinc-cadmium efflux system outer membrane protein
MHMLWKRVVSVLATLVALQSAAQGQISTSALGPADLGAIAIQRNRDFLAVKQRIAETQGLLRQAGLRPVAGLEIEQSTGRLLGSRGEREFSAGYAYTIEMYGKRGKRIAFAKKSTEIAEAEIADQTRLLAHEVKARYADAITEQQKLDMIDRLIEVNREYYRLTEARIQEGDAAPLEGQLFLADLSRTEAQQVVISERTDRALMELRKVVGVAPSEQLPLREGVLPILNGFVLPEWQERAIQERPDLRILQLLEEQALAEVELARAEGKPDVTVSARYSRSNSAFDQLGLDDSRQPTPLRDQDNILTFGFAIPIFRPKRNQGAIESALARRTAAQLRGEHLEGVIRLEVEAAFRRWEAANRALEILNQGVIGPSERNLVVVREAYFLGQLRILDVLNEQRRLIETQLDYFDAQSELFQSYAELERAVGGSIQ